jgi:hypothetical protein
MSMTRMLFLVLLVLLVGAYAAYTSPGSRLWMVVTGRCGADHPPPECTLAGPHHGPFAWFTPKR